jgi:ATP-binding protein involved in chromosome partitioning
MVNVSVVGETVTVTITLPVPSGDLRAVLERDVVKTVVTVDGVSTVECRFEPTVPPAGGTVDLIPEVSNVVVVSSGKGGVGKSTVAVNLATALADAGASVGLLDADVYGPNAPAMLGLAERKPETTISDRIVPREAQGVKVMSIGFITEEADPVIWRGPMVDEFLKQLFGDVAWGALDYLVVDTPPGTGDAQLSLVQHLPVAGAVVVTTPQPVAVDDARRGLRGFAQYDVPVLGIVENMTEFECPDCGTRQDLFGAGGASQLGDEFNVPVLGQIPVDPDIGTLETDEADSDPPGISIFGLGRLQLPRTREERERPTSVPPVAVRGNGGKAGQATTLVATRVAARLAALARQRAPDDGCHDAT